MRPRNFQKRIHNWDFRCSAEDKILAELPESFDLLCHNGCLASFLRTDQGAQVQPSQQYMLHT